MKWKQKAAEYGLREDDYLIALCDTHLDRYAPLSDDELDLICRRLKALLPDDPPPVPGQYQRAAILVQHFRERGATTSKARALAVERTKLPRAKVAQADRDYNYRPKKKQT